METVALTGPIHLIAQFVGTLLLLGFAAGWFVGFLMGFHRRARHTPGNILPPLGGSVMSRAECQPKFPLNPAPGHVHRARDVP